MRRFDRNKTAESANKRLEQRFIDSKIINESFESPMTEEGDAPKDVIRFIEKLQKLPAVQNLLGKLDTKPERIYALVGMAGEMELTPLELNRAAQELKKVAPDLESPNAQGGEEGLDEAVEWTPDIQNDFDRWKADGNVTQNTDGTYSTQDAQWRNRLKDLEALKQYFIKEFF